MPPERVFDRADQHPAASRPWSSVRLNNAIGLSIILTLVFLITATGVRGNSVWWLIAAMAQIVFITSRLGMLTFDAMRGRAAYPRLFGLDVHPVYCRIVLELYFALLLILPFTTIFDGWIAEAP